MPTELDSTFRELIALPKAKRSMALQRTIGALTNEQRAELAAAMRKLNRDAPTNRTINRLVWGAIALVLVASLLVWGGLSYFVAPEDNLTGAETLLDIFTTVAAYVLGLFTPSPVIEK